MYGNISLQRAFQPPALECSYSEKPTSSSSTGCHTISKSVKPELTTGSSQCQGSGGTPRRHESTFAQIELEFERYLKELRPVSGIPQTVEEAAAQQEREDRMARTFEEKLHKERNKTLIARIIKSEQRKPFKQRGGAGGGEKGSEDKGKGDS